MKKSLLYFALICAIAFSFSGCKDEKVAASEYKTQGFIKGTIKGTTAEDSTEINESFNLTSYPATNPDYYTINQASQEKLFSIYRQEINTRRSFIISFTLPNSSTSVTSLSAHFGYFKETDKLFIFQMNTMYKPLAPQNTFAFSSFSFDETTGRVKASYLLSGQNNSTGKDATVAGEIDVIVKKQIQ